MEKLTADISNQDHKVIYFLRGYLKVSGVESGYTKIGITGRGKARLSSRIAQLESRMPPIRLEPIAAFHFDRAKELERHLMTCSTERPWFGEWLFDPTLEETNRLITIASEQMDASNLLASQAAISSADTVISTAAAIMNHLPSFEVNVLSGTQLYVVSDFCKLKIQHVNRSGSRVEIYAGRKLHSLTNMQFIAPHYGCSYSGGAIIGHSVSLLALISLLIEIQQRGERLLRASASDYPGPVPLLQSG